MASNDERPQSSRTPNRTIPSPSPSAHLPDMSRFVPSFPGPGPPYQSYTGSNWSDLPFLLPPGLLPQLGMDMYSTAAFFHSLQASPMYSPMALMQQSPFNPLFSVKDPLKASPNSSKSESKSKSLKTLNESRLSSSFNQFSPDRQDHFKRNSNASSAGPSKTSHSHPLNHTHSVSKSDPSISRSCENVPFALLNKVNVSSPVLISDEGSNHSSDDNISNANSDSKNEMHSFSRLTEKTFSDSTGLMKTSNEVESKQIDEKFVSENSNEQINQNNTSTEDSIFASDSNFTPATSSHSVDEASYQRLNAEKEKTEFDPLIETRVEQPLRPSITLPPRKRLTRNPDDIPDHSHISSSSASYVHSSYTSSRNYESNPIDSPQTSNFRSCWKKFSAKMNNNGPTPFRSMHMSGKPMYDCRHFFQKMSAKDACKNGMMGKSYLSNMRFYHRNRKEQAEKEGPISPRVTRSQARQKKTTDDTNPSEPQEPPPIRKSNRKKTSNSRYDAPDMITSGNKSRKSRNSKKSNQPNENEDASNAGEEGKKEGEESRDTTTPLELVNDKPETTPISIPIVELSVESTSTTTTTTNQTITSTAQIAVTTLSTTLVITLTQPPSQVAVVASSADIRKLENCDRKSTSSGLSTCSGDAPFDTDTPISLPPKFRHTKKKSAYISLNPEEVKAMEVIPKTSITEPSSKESNEIDIETLTTATSTSTTNATSTVNLTSTSRPTSSYKSLNIFISTSVNSETTPATQLYAEANTQDENHTHIDKSNKVDEFVKVENNIIISTIETSKTTTTKTITSSLSNTSKSTTSNVICTPFCSNNEGELTNFSKKTEHNVLAISFSPSTSKKNIFSYSNTELTLPSTTTTPPQQATMTQQQAIKPPSQATSATQATTSTQSNEIPVSINTSTLTSTSSITSTKPVNMPKSSNTKTHSKVDTIVDIKLDDGQKEILKSPTECGLMKEIENKTKTENNSIAISNTTTSEVTTAIKSEKVEIIEADKESKKKDLQNESLHFKTQPGIPSEIIGTNTRIETTKTESLNEVRSGGIPSEFKLKIDLRERSAAEKRRPVVAIIPIKNVAERDSIIPCEGGDHSTIPTIIQNTEKDPMIHKGDENDLMNQSRTENDSKVTNETANVPETTHNVFEKDSIIESGVEDDSSIQKEADKDSSMKKSDKMIPSLKSGVLKTSTENTCKVKELGKEEKKVQQKSKTIKVLLRCNDSMGCNVSIKEAAEVDTNEEKLHEKKGVGRQADTSMEFSAASKCERENSEKLMKPANEKQNEMILTVSEKSSFNGRKVGIKTHVMTNSGMDNEEILHEDDDKVDKDEKKDMVENDKVDSYKLEAGMEEKEMEVKKGRKKKKPGRKAKKKVNTNTNSKEESNVGKLIAESTVNISRKRIKTKISLKTIFPKHEDISLSQTDQQSERSFTDAFAHEDATFKISQTETLGKFVASLPETSSIISNPTNDQSQMVLSPTQAHCNDNKKVDVYDWNQNEEEDDDLMPKFRANRGRGGVSPPKKEKDNFDKLVNTCKVVTVMMHKLEKLEGCNVAKEGVEEFGPEASKEETSIDTKLLEKKVGVERSEVRKKRKKIKEDGARKAKKRRLQRHRSQEVSLNPEDTIAPISETNIITSEALRFSKENNNIIMATKVDKSDSAMGGQKAKIDTLSVKFKLKKIGCEWISVNKGKSNKEVTKKEDKKGHKKNKQPSKHSERPISIFVSDSLAQGFVCNDEELKQAFIDKILISDFFNSHFPDATNQPPPPIPDVTFMFSEDRDEVEVVLQTRQVFFTPSELEEAFTKLTISPHKKIHRQIPPFPTKNKHHLAPIFPNGTDHHPTPIHSLPKESLNSYYNKQSSFDIMTDFNNANNTRNINPINPLNILLQSNIFDPSTHCNIDSSSCHSNAKSSYSNSLNMSYNENMKHVDKSSTHSNFPNNMDKNTITNNTNKKIVTTSNNRSKDKVLGYIEDIDSLFSLDGFGAVNDNNNTFNKTNMNINSHNNIPSSYSNYASCGNSSNYNSSSYNNHNTYNNSCNTFQPPAAALLLLDEALSYCLNFNDQDALDSIPNQLINVK